jgi:hypothetical protein
VTPECRSCGRRLKVGEEAWADDWKVLDVQGTTATWRHETRYTCNDCVEGDS